MQDEQNNQVVGQVQTPTQQAPIGYRTNQVNVMLKDPGIATVLSFFWTGLGQIYNGQIGKGLLFILIQAINVLLMFVIIGFITFPLFWVYGMYDANKTAKATHGL